MSAATLSLEDIRKAMKLIDELPPEPFFAASALFPPHHAIRFARDGRDYCGAHPDFWKRIPASARGQAASLFAIEIVDLDIPINREGRNTVELASL